MNTIKYSNDEFDKIVKALSQGDTIAFPTDTVFGLGCVFDNEDAIERVKWAKGRSETKPLPMMCCNLEMIEQVAEVNADAKILIENLTPGALTLILNKKPCVPDFVTNGFKTIAIRVPNDDFILNVLKTLKKPMLVTSANLSGKPSMKDDSEVLKELDGRINGIVLGEANSTIASTIVDMTDNLKILREGIITKEEIDKVLKDFRNRGIK